MSSPTDLQQRGSDTLNVIRLYPDTGLGVVVMGNTTRYDHEAILAAATTLG